MNEIINIINSNKIYYNKIECLLALSVIPNNLKIGFALYCAKDCFKYIDAVKYPDLQVKTAKCLELVADYLLGKTVSKEDLDAATADAVDLSIADNAITLAAVFAAANAAYATAYAANGAVNAATYAANAAGYAADAAVKRQKLKEFYDYLLNMIIKELKLDKTFKILYVA